MSDDDDDGDDDDDDDDDDNGDDDVDYDEGSRESDTMLPPTKAAGVGVCSSAIQRDGQSLIWGHRELSQKFRND